MLATRSTVSPTRTTYEENSALLRTRLNAFPAGRDDVTARYDEPAPGDWECHISRIADPPLALRIWFASDDEIAVEVGKSRTNFFAGVSFADDADRALAVIGKLISGDMRVREAKPGGLGSSKSASRTAGEPSRRQDTASGPSFLVPRPSLRSSG